MTVATVKSQAGHSSREAPMRPARLRSSVASRELEPKPSMPPSANGEGEDHVRTATHRRRASPSPCAELQELQAQRVATVRAQIRLDNARRGLVLRKIGWRWDTPDAESAKLKKAAAALIEALESGEPVAPEHAGTAADVAGFCLAIQLAREPLDGLRAKLEKRMRELARGLPVWPWVEAVNGLGDLGLAIIVGESGDLSNYANPGKLWKRLGLAPGPCYAMLAGDGREVQAKPKRRRSAIWTVADSLFKAKNSYTDLYRQRREYEVSKHPEFDTGKVNVKTGRMQVTKHCDNRARRYAEKRMILELWKAWRETAH